MSLGNWEDEISEEAESEELPYGTGFLPCRIRVRCILLSCGRHGFIYPDWGSEGGTFMNRKIMAASLAVLSLSGGAFCVEASDWASTYDNDGFSEADINIFLTCIDRG